MKIVIMAGGGGTRLWPISRQNLPKQFGKIVGDSSLLEQTVARLRPRFAQTDIYYCLGENLLPALKNIFPDLSDEQMIIEPEKRDTAPAMGLAAAYLFQRFPDEPIAFVPSDHHIGDNERFLDCLTMADKYIRQTGKMLDIAVPPTFPSTVLGYTKIGPRVAEENGILIHEFAGHTEKPPFELAQKYLRDGAYWWHASYYMWTPRKILDEFNLLSPAHGQRLTRIMQALQTNDREVAAHEFREMEKISFDYAITEKMSSEKILIIKGDFGWSDVGAFDVLYDALRKEVDGANNVVHGRWVGEDTRDCLIMGGERLIATVGVNNIVIVDAGDSLLVCDKSRAQEVKKIIDKMRNTDRESFL